MVVTKAARRYAGALLELAVEKKSVKEVYADMEMISAAIRDSRELLLFLRSPVIRRDKKSSTLVALFSSRVSPLTLAFMKLLTEKRRENQIPGICISFLQQYDTQMGIVHVKVRSAYALSETTTKSLVNALSLKLGKEVFLSVEMDASLIGGIQIQAGDTIIDGSVRSRLNRMSEAFINNVA